MPDDQPIDPVSVPRRIMIMISIVIGSTLYSTTLLIASTLLPQMQGAMSATQDEIAWTMTFNILATAVATPMTGWLVARFGRRNLMVGAMALFSLATYLCGAAESLESLVHLAHGPGRRRRAGHAAVADHPVRQLSAPAAPDDHLDLRHDGGDRPGDRSGARRLHGGAVQLALGVLRAGPGRGRLVHRSAAQHAARPAAPPGKARLDRVSQPFGGDFLRAARAVARAAARLVRIAGNLADDDRRRPRLLYLRRAQRDRGTAVPEPATAARPQLRARAAAGRRVRDAERHADGAAAAAVETVCRVSRRADRRGAGGARRRRDDRVFRRDVPRQARSADRHGARLRPAGRLRACG